MAEAGQARQTSGKTVPITIKNGGVDPSPAKAVVGDTVEFHNEESSSVVVQFLDNGVQLPIALEIPPGGKCDFLATVTGTVDYSIGLGRPDGGSFGPDDDSYQVIVGSGAPDQR
jgi:plastocyanin